MDPANRERPSWQEEENDEEASSWSKVLRRRREAVLGRE